MTVSVTRLSPMFEQLNDETFNVIEAIPQASDEPLFICPAVITAVPFASNATVIFWQIAIGLVASFTVTTDVQVDTFP